MAPKKKLVKNKATKSKTKDGTEGEEEIENKFEEEEEETETESDGPKSKKPIDIEAVLEPAPIIEEKEEDIATPSEDSDEFSTDELSLDDDELNPFGDKWEQ